MGFVVKEPEPQQVRLNEAGTSATTGYGSNGPAGKWKFGNVSVTAWKNKVTLSDGRSFDKMTFSVAKNYKDKEGNWKTSSSFTQDELMKLYVLLQKVLGDLASD